MHFKRTFRFLKKEYVNLLLILILTAYTTYKIHFDYPLPIHVDEWKSLASITAVEKDGINYTEPYLQKDRVTNDLEIGFFLTLAIVHLITNLSWVTIFQFGPTLISLLSVIAIFFLAKRWNAGLETALLYSLIPTTLSLLGPAFLVPATLSSLFWIIALYILTNNKFETKHLILLMILTVYLAYAYPPAVMILGLISIPVVVYLRRPVALLSFLISAIASLPQYLPILSKATIDAVAFNAVPVISDVLRESGFIQTSLFAVGVFMTFRNDKKELKSLSITAIILLTLILIFRNLGHTFFIPPTRIYYYIMIIMSLIGGYTLSVILKNKRRLLLTASLILAQPVIFKIIKNIFARETSDLIMITKITPFILTIAIISILLERLSRKRISTKLSIILALTFLLLPILYSHSQISYYHVITENEYDTFQEIKSIYTGGIAAIDPWRALAFTPITGIPVYSRIGDGPDSFFAERNNELFTFFNMGCINSTFIKLNNISIVYSNFICTNSSILKKEGNFYTSNYT